MNLYFFEHAVNTKETGPYNPQIEKLYPDIDSSSDLSIYRLYDSPQKFPSISPKIDYAQLKKGAKLSDILSSAMFVRYGFLISEKVRSIIANFRLPEYRLYKVPIQVGEGTLVDYFWLHMLFEYNGKSFNDIQYENLIYSRSVFHIEKDFVKLSQIDIQSHEDFKSQVEGLKSNHYISASSLFLNSKSINEMPDIFKLPIVNRVKWIIKQSLRDAIVSNQCTGVKITEIRNIKFV